MIYLSDDQVLAIVQDEGYLIRDLGLLSSAVARPSSVFYGVEPYTDLWSKGAALLESITRNHPLVDGNKRLGFLLVVIFLNLNDFDLLPSDEHAPWVLSVCTGQMPLAESAEYLASRAVELDY